MVASSVHFKRKKKKVQLLYFLTAGEGAAAGLSYLLFTEDHGSVKTGDSGTELQSSLAVALATGFAGTSPYSVNINSPKQTGTVKQPAPHSPLTLPECLAVVIRYSNFHWLSTLFSHCIKLKVNGFRRYPVPSMLLPKKLKVLLLRENSAVTLAEFSANKASF